MSNPEWVGELTVTPRPDAYAVVTQGGGIGIAPKEQPPTDSAAEFPRGWVEVGYIVEDE